MISRLVPALIAALFLATTAWAGSVEECRALYSADTGSALKRWRGPRANANKYPLHCENAGFLNVQLPTPRLPALPRLSGMSAVGAAPAIGVPAVAGPGMP